MDVRRAYLDAAAAAEALVCDPALGRTWNDESVLVGWSNGLLAAHLARSILQVEWFLDADAPAAATIDAVTYYAALTGTTDPTSALNVGVRERSEETMRDGCEALGATTSAALARLTARIPSERSDRCISSFGRPMLLDEYLRTRLVELCFHGDDLALSLGVTSTPPPGALALAGELLFNVATRRHGPLATLRYLGRRERADADVLRVL